MNWISKLLKWLHMKEQTLAEGLEQFETIAPTIYARLKGYDYSTVMIWAFGQNWQNIPYSDMISTFEKLHPEFNTTNPDQIMISSILDIIDAFAIKIKS